jgi:hypothetical protein
MQQQRNGIVAKSSRITRDEFQKPQCYRAGLSDLTIYPFIIYLLLQQYLNSFIGAATNNCFLVRSSFPLISCMHAGFFSSQAIAENLPACDAIESTSVAGPGFVNIVLSNTWIAKVWLSCFTCKASLHLLLLLLHFFHAN